MKVLQVNCVFKNGSTGKIVYDLHNDLINEGIESIVCYGRGKCVEDPFVYKICSEWYSKINNLWSRVTGVMYGGCFFSTNKLIGIIKKTQPDIVHLQCINGYFVNIYRLVKWLKKNNMNTILTLHAEFMYTGGCGYSVECNQWRYYKGCGQDKCPRWRSETNSFFFDRARTMWRLMKDAFVGFDDNLIITSVSTWLMERAKQSTVLEGKKHRLVQNGLDTSIFHPYNTAKMRKSVCPNNEKIIFHSTAFFSTDPNHIKGGYYIVELAKRLVAYNIKILIAGNYSSDVLLPDNVIMLGRIEDQKILASYYSMADLTVLTSQRETYSMVTAESLCCGTPIVGFKAGAPETISLKEFSEFVDYGNIDALEKVVKKWLAIEKDNRIVGAAKSKYDKTVMTRRYIDIYKELLRG